MVFQKTERFNLFILRGHYVKMVKVFKAAKVKETKKFSKSSDLYEINILKKFPCVHENLFNLSLIHI